MPSPIVTLTLNPALDLSSTADVIEPTHKIRTRDEHIDPGGGGINVARVIHALGGHTLALILAGGATGQLVGELLTEAGVPHRMLPMKGRTRVSLTVHEAATGKEYRFVPEGPDISADAWEAALTALALAECDWLVGSGSLPRGVPADIYARIARTASARGQNFILDTAGEPLRAAMHCGVHLIKPSLREFEMLVGRSLPTTQEREAEAVALVRSGAVGMIAVSLGAEGAMLATAEGAVHLPALPGPVRSAVGAGDAFLAGMTLALGNGGSPIEALAWGIATGATAVANVGTARVTREAVHQARARLQTG